MTADVVPSDYEKHIELRYWTSPQRRRSFVAYRIILRDFSPYVAVRCRRSASRINTSSSFSRCCPWHTSLPRRRHSKDNYVPHPNRPSSATSYVGTRVHHDLEKKPSKSRADFLDRWIRAIGYFSWERHAISDETRLH
jgi:hypothetical protein